MDMMPMESMKFTALSTLILLATQKLEKAEQAW
jgi:hypothetical protein